MIIILVKLMLVLWYSYFIGINQKDNRILKLNKNKRILFKLLLLRVKI